MTAVLVDTSVWVDHLRAADARLVSLLESEAVVVHPMVLGELSLGWLQDRRTVLSRLDKLPRPALATHEEVLGMVEFRRLFGRGVGWVDAHLLASALLSDDVRLWSHDRRLSAVAAELDLAWRIS